METANDGLEEVPPMINMAIWDKYGGFPFPGVKVASQS